MSWGTYDYDEDNDSGVYHVVPIDDDDEHQFSRMCICRPRVQAVDDMSTMIIHNSFDGREAYEEAIQIINPPED